MQEEATTIDIAVLQTEIEALKGKIATFDNSFDLSDVEEAIEELEDRIAGLETTDALIENEMRTIMSDHEKIGEALSDLGKDNLSEDRQYGDYGR